MFGEFLMDRYLKASLQFSTALKDTISAQVSSVINPGDRVLVLKYMIHNLCEEHSRSAVYASKSVYFTAAFPKHLIN